MGLINLLAGSGTRGKSRRLGKGQSCPLPESLAYFLSFPSPVPTQPSQTLEPQSWGTALASVPALPAQLSNSLNASSPMGITTEGLSVPVPVFPTQPS